MSLAGTHRLPEQLDGAAFPDSGKALKVESKDAYMLAWGTSVPSDDDAGYATGCLYLKLDGGDATSLYVNEGDEDNADFNAINVAS